MAEDTQPAKRNSRKAAHSTNDSAVKQRHNVTFDLVDAEEQREEPEPELKRARTSTAGILNRRPRGPPVFASDACDNETAWAAGLNPAGLSEEEENVLPDGADEEMYVQVRNYVLAKWRSDVSQWMSYDSAAFGLSDDYKPLAKAAWTLLNRYGYINFGVSDAITQHMIDAAEDKGSVVVIGAGLAGLVAARQLRAMGHRVVVLEGRNYAGGRVCGWKLEGHDAAAVGDLGGSVITGIDGNPLAVIATQLGIPMHSIRNECPLYNSKGAKVDKAVDDKIEQLFNTVLGRTSSYRDTMPSADKVSLGTALTVLLEEALQSDSSDEDENGERSDEHVPSVEQQLVHWHLANLEFANAAQLRSLSLAHWDQDDPYEMPGAHVFLPGSNRRLVEALADDLPVFYNSPVKLVQYAGNGVAVHTYAAVFKADAVLVTVPLGVLKKEAVAFEPPLSDRKRGAISNLGFGLLNKVVLLFPYCFWDDHVDMFGLVADNPDDRGEFFLFYSYAHISGGALLIALVAGKAAEEFEKLSTTTATSRVMRVLTRIFEPHSIAVPAPLQALCTRWGQDPMAFGAYSSVSVGSQGGDDYNIMAESIGERLFFGGEATTRKYPATMHGAFHTGLREAANIAAAIEKQRQHQLTAAAAAAVVADNGDVATAADESAVDVLLQLALLLNKVFEDGMEAMDFQLGSFSALYGDADSEFEDLALLRIDIARTKASTKKHGPTTMALHAVVATDDVESIYDIDGGDGVRLCFLINDCGVKFTGHNEVSQQVLRMLVHICDIRNLAVPDGLRQLMTFNDDAGLVAGAAKASSTQQQSNDALVDKLGSNSVVRVEQTG